MISLYNKCNNSFSHHNYFFYSPITNFYTFQSFLVIFRQVQLSKSTWYKNTQCHTTLGSPYFYQTCRYCEVNTFKTYLKFIHSDPESSETCRKLLYCKKYNCAN